MSNWARRAYLPTKYREWRREAELQLLSQHRPTEPINRCGITITLTGKHSRRGDLDNISGAILDALVSVGILKDDNMMVIHSLQINLSHSKESPIALISISEK